MIEIKEGNLFEAPVGGVICHQVNCLGTMGAGVAAQFKTHFPTTFSIYRNYVNQNLAYSRDSSIMLGHVITQIENGYWAACLFAQNLYGRDGSRYTNYLAFRHCCQVIADYFPNNMIINMPYKIGCGFGGGDWQIIYNIIEEEFKNFNVVLWKL